MYVLWTCAILSHYPLLASTIQHLLRCHLYQPEGSETQNDGHSQHGCQLKIIRVHVGSLGFQLCPSLMVCLGATDEHSRIYCTSLDAILGEYTVI